jgi:glycyl-tRNA synthetase alpha chain
VQNVDNVYDLNFNGLPEGKGRISYGDVFLQAEQEFSRYNFEEADTDILLKRFVDCENECKALLARNLVEGKPTLALPAYDQCIKASHTFNLLDSRGVISVTERQAYILRVRELAKACCEAWSNSVGGRA